MPASAVLFQADEPDVLAPDERIAELDVWLDAEPIVQPREKRVTARLAVCVDVRFDRLAVRQPDL